ncbi:MAG: tryptophan-rich sensory protein [Ornithinimicrobium sp.]
MTLAEVFCVVGTLYGVGVLGTRVEESAGGALAADATRLAPAGPAFSIWSVIYAGLAAYTLYQWLPGQSTRQVHRRTGWLAAASMVLNAGWLLVTQQGWIWGSVGVILALAVVLGLLLGRLGTVGTVGLPDRIVLDGTFGLYLGWVAVATCANVTAALVASGVEPAAWLSDLAAVLVLAVVAGLGVVFARQLGARYAVAAAMAWGLSWVAVGRVSDEPASWVTAVAALVTALLVLGVVVRERRRGA